MGIGDVLLSTSAMSTRDAAITFARSGIPVFPCAPGEKRPLTSAGFHDATCDVERVSAWWRRWPAANLGVPTGSGSGIEAVDVDVTPDASGFPALERAFAAGLVDRDLARVRTPSGGLHLYFPASEERPQRCWQSAAAHIDFRGEGGYVLVPPSRVVTATGPSRYRLFSLTTAIARAIDASALREFLEPRPQRTEHQREVVATEVEPARLAGWVSRLREGERNSGLFWAACRLVEAGFDQGAVESALATAAADAGLSEHEITATIRSANRQASSPSSASTASSASPSRARAPADVWNDHAPRRISDAPCLS